MPPTHNGLSLRDALVTFVAHVSVDMKDAPEDFPTQDVAETIRRVRGCLRAENVTGVLYQAINLISYYEDEIDDSLAIYHETWAAWNRLEDVLRGLLNQEVL